MDKFYIRVGFTITRPIVVDEHFAFVALMADSEIEAHRVAAQMVSVSEFDVQMPTSTETIMVEV